MQFCFTLIGKIEVKSLTKKNRSLDKQQRRHQAKQIRKNKREDVLGRKRKLGTEHSPPHVIVSVFVITTFTDECF